MAFVPNTAGINYLLHAPQGIVGQWLDDIGDRVQVEAEGLAPVGDGRDGSHLFEKIERSQLIPTAEGQMVRVGSRKPYTAAVVKGSVPHKIYPRRRRVLRFVARGGDVVYARIVNHPGTKANNFLMEAARRILGGS